MNQPAQCRHHGHHRLGHLWPHLSADIQHYLATCGHGTGRQGLAKMISVLLRPELQCLLLHRIAHTLHVQGLGHLARCVAALNRLAYRVTITPQSCIGPGCRLPHPAGVAFHGSAGEGLTLFALAVCWPSGAFLPGPGPVDAGPRLGNGVTVGGMAAVLGRVVVGDHVVIGPMSIVDRDVLACSLVFAGSNRPREIAEP